MVRMKLFFAKGEENSECESTRYIQINNCGWFEDLVDAHVIREAGRLDYQLLYIKSGELTVKTETETYLLKEGNVLLYRPGQLQDYKIGKVNVDEQKELARQFRVLTIPTLVVIKDGKVVEFLLEFLQLLKYSYRIH